MSSSDRFTKAQGQSSHRTRFHLRNTRIQVHLLPGRPGQAPVERRGEEAGEEGTQLPAAGEAHGREAGIAWKGGD